MKKLKTDNIFSEIKKLEKEYALEYDENTYYAEPIGRAKAYFDEKKNALPAVTSPDIIRKRQKAIAEIRGNKELKDYLGAFVNFMDDEEKRFEDVFKEQKFKYTDRNELIKICIDSLDSITDTEEYKRMKHLSEKFRDGYSRKRGNAPWFKYDIKSDGKKIKITVYTDSGNEELDVNENEEYDIVNESKDFNDVVWHTVCREVSSLNYKLACALKSVCSIVRPFVYAASILDEREEAGVSVCAAEFSGNGIDIEGAMHTGYIDFWKKKINFTPMNIYLNPEENSGSLLTGPNNAGKTTLLELISLMLHDVQTIGSVSAQSARMGWIPNAIVKTGSGKNADRGFGEEEENKKGHFQILVRKFFKDLNEAPDRSLVIIDEYFDGTTNKEGIRHLYETISEECRKKNSYILITTHMDDLLQGLPNITSIGITEDHKVLYGTPVHDSTAIKIIDEERKIFDKK